tara:strand:- start:146 stop:961 length:816 start_codon:yes stop_codon:yes gene_type:complete
MVYIISLTTTPPRINNFIYSLNQLVPELPKDCHKIIINITNNYRRFKDIHLNNFSLKTLKKFKNKVELNVVSFDYGPLTKLIGGLQYLQKKSLQYCIVLIDDDIQYHKEYLYNLVNNCPRIVISSGSGFNIIEGQYVPGVLNEINYVEGFSGIYIPYRLINPKLQQFANFYKCLHPIYERDRTNLPQEVLLSCFMGDDFIISEFYKNKLWTQNNWRKNLIIQQYGLGCDALQNNNIFGTNMGTYNFLLEHKKIFNQWINKLNVNNEIKSIQ